MSGIWSEEATADLTRLAAEERLSASKIAARLADERGICVKPWVIEARLRRLGVPLLGGPVDWPEDRVDVLRQMSRDGYSAAQIAAELGVSRSAVLGKASRLGIRLGAGPRVAKVAAPRPKPPPRPVRLLPPPPVKAAPPPPPPLAVPVAPREPMPPAEPVTLMDLREHHCRFPLWHNARPDPATALYCGARRPIGRPYCDAHLAATGA